MVPPAPHPPTTPRLPERHAAPADGGGRIPVLQIPETVSSEENTAFWRQAIAPFYSAWPVSAEPPTPHRCRMGHLGRMLLVDAAMPAQRFLRDPKHGAGRSEIDHILLQTCLTGRAHMANGKESFVQGPGSFWIIDLDRPASAVTNGSYLTLALPRALVEKELPFLATQSGAIMPADSTAAMVLSDYLRALNNRLDSVTYAESQTIGERIIQLLDPLLGLGDLQAAPSRSATMTAILAYIDRNLGDPALDAARIAARFHMSRATLYRLFKNTGGVAGIIQRRRLSAAFLALGSPANSGKSVLEIAMDQGFINASHFSRAFRDHFGLSPSAVRDRGMSRNGLPPPLPPVTATGTVDHMRHWAASLC